MNILHLLLVTLSLNCVVGLRDTCCCADYDISHYLKPNKERIYKIVDCPKTYVEALNDCRAWNGDLVWIEDRIENQWLAYQLMLRWGLKTAFPAWIGLHGSSFGAGCWETWTVGINAGSTNWNGNSFGQPPNCNSNLCAFTINQPSHKNNGHWRYADCKTPMKYVCKKLPSGASSQGSHVAYDANK